ncbi:MAG: DNA polymerase III subunit delta [Cytophagaceae bacterium]|jgi:DNA polymerase-3 subunit delta'|nr:DNA polymerase III subunit delta [Cytophagaceae bacterium]
MQFKDIPGLEDVKKTLVASVRESHIAHAQLFAGPEGSANLALALAYATYIQCENRGEEDSCGECASCSKNKKYIHPDLHFVFPISSTKQVSKDPLSALFYKDWRNFLLENPYNNLVEWGNFIGAENKQLLISVDESRNVIKTLSLKSFESEYKIMIIWLPEVMRHEAANAILKILEEPPVKTLFLLVTNNLEKIITTILSRTQKVFIPAFEDTLIAGYLREHYQVDEKKALQLSYLADGNMDKAIRMMSEADEDHQQMFRDWMRMCFLLYRKTSNLIELTEWSEMFAKLGRESQKNLLLFGMNILRETLVYKYTATSLVRLPQEDLTFVENFSKVLSDEKIEIISAKLNQSSLYIERNASPKMVFMAASFQIAQVFNQS